MSVVFLVRHGRSTANTAGVLAGWTPGVHLDDRGREQASTMGERLAVVRLAAIVASPLERTIETAEAILDAQGDRAEIALDARFGECRYGDWTGRKLAQLAKRPLWKSVQSTPSAVRFPGPDGEAMIDMQARAVSAIHDWNERLGNSARYAVVSHGDVIKAILADALGMHLDMFQRIAVDPGSLSIIDYGPKLSAREGGRAPIVVRVNDTAADLSVFAGGRGGAAATVGGGAGPQGSATRGSGAGPQGSATRRSGAGPQGSATRRSGAGPQGTAKSRRN